MIKLSEQKGNTLHGILLIALFSCAAFYIAEIPFVRSLSFSPLIVGIILGMLYANSLRNRLPETWVPGIKFCTKQVLRAGIVLYGFRLTLNQVAAVGLPAGLGDPMFGGMEGRLAAALFGVPAVKGVEFGAGFGAARMRGSEHNDPFALREGRVVTKTNHAGGILGGITTGMPILLRAAFKPTPSIAMEQDSVSLSRMEAEKLVVTGRHDPCIVPRAVPVVEAVTALVLLDALLDPPARLGRA